MNYCLILLLMGCFVVVALIWSLSTAEDKIEKLKTESGYTKDELEAKINGYNEVSEKLNAKQKETDELQSKLEEYENQITKRDDKIKSLECELIDAKESLENIAKDLSDAKDMLAEAKTGADKLESRNTELESLAESKEAEFKKEIDKANDIIKSISEKAGSLYKLHNEIEELHKGVKVRQEDVKRLADETATKEKEINELSSKIDNKSIEFECIYSEMR